MNLNTENVKKTSKKTTTVAEQFEAAVSTSSEVADAMLSTKATTIFKGRIIFPVLASKLQFSSDDSFEQVVAGIEAACAETMSRLDKTARRIASVSLRTLGTKVLVDVGLAQTAADMQKILVGAEV